jgi:hypothetical protein
MNGKPRWVVAIAVAIAVGFMLLVPFTFLPLGGFEPIAALACGIAAGRYVYRRSAEVNRGVFELMLLGAFLTGAVGFAGGFFGPMIFAPDANQGPLLGLFITGPAGFALGGIAGLIYGLTRRGGEGEPAPR